MSDLGKAVFLSYASQDVAAARRIADALEAAGVEVWFDQSELRGGDAWDRKLRRQIKECALFIAVLSQNTEARLEGYFRREWKLAIDRTHDIAEEKAFLLPVVIDETPDNSPHVPEKFHDVQWTRLARGQTTAAFCERVRGLVGGNVVAGAVPLRQGYGGQAGPGLSAKALATASPASARQATTQPAAAPPPPQDFAAAKSSIVVLPFDNLSPDPDNAYFADGLTEEITADLSKVQALRVISRTSAMHFKGTAKPLPDIARALNVRYVLEGSVRRSADKLRITAQLIDAATDAHLWSEKFSAQMEDIFDLQEQLSRRIIEALKVALTPDESRRLSARPLPNIQAYDLWLRIRQETWSFTSAGYDRAIRLADQAMAIAGENALIHAALAYSHYVAYDFGFSHEEATLNLVGRHSRRAIELDPELPLAWVAAGSEQYKRGSFRMAIPLFRRAVSLDRSEDALVGLVFMLSAVGRNVEAQTLALEAQARAPFHSLVAIGVAYANVYAGRFADAQAACKAYLDRIPTPDPLVAWWLAKAMVFAGQEEAAAAQFRRVADMNVSIVSDASELFLRALRGDRDATREWCASHPQLAEMAKTDECVPIYLASAFACVSDFDRALEYLEYGVAWGFSNHCFLVEHNRFLAPLRGHPRFEALLEKARAQEREFRDVS